MKLLLLKIISFICMSAIYNVAQGQDLQGLVVDITHSPVDKVSVFVNGEKISETNAEGIFNFSKDFALPLKIRLEHPDFFIANFQITKNNEVFKLSRLSNYENLEEVILSSTYQKESKVIVLTTKISSEKFGDYSPIDLVAAINETPGVFIQSGAINTNRIVIRGVGSRTLYGTNKIRAYFNGIPITNGIGETAIDVFDPENLQSLEILSLRHIINGGHTYKGYYF